MNNSWYNHPFSGHTNRFNNKYGLAVLLLLFLVILLLLSYLLTHKKKKTVQGLPVITDQVRTRDVPVYITALGNVTPLNTVTVRTQINGLLMQVNFREGQRVKAGEQLALIDERLLMAQLTQYKGQLLRDQALLANALLDLKRYKTLWKEDSISQQTLATQESLVQQYQGAVEVDLGLIKSTEVNLIYTRISSPVDGRIGLRLVDPGNFVQTSDTNGIAVITTLNPVTVLFTVPEDDIPEIQAALKKQEKLSVQAWDRTSKHLLATGVLTAVDNLINTGTGTLRLRAQFEHAEDRLFANQFVNIHLKLKTIHKARVISTAAILHGSQGDYVFIVRPDKTVTMQKIKTSVVSGEDTVIENGLKPGQQVVTDGADQLTEGSRIRLARSKTDNNNPDNIRGA